MLHSNGSAPPLRALLALVLALAAAAFAAPAALAAGPVMSTGQLHTCAVQSDGTPVCWGTNNNGVVSGAAGKGPLKAVSSSEGNSCGLEVDGDASCWGDDFYGQVSGPASGGPYLAVAAGRYYTCAIKQADKSLACWGERPPYYVSKPAGMPTSGTYKAISTGASHACAIRTDGVPVCWGDDGGGRSSGAPTTPVKSIFAGDAATCAVMADDTARCWGDGSYGQTSVPSDLGTIEEIGLTSEVGCAIKTGGSVQCWGSNANGLLNLPDGLGPVTSLSTGSYQVCVRKADKQPVCWGYDGGEGRVTGAEGKGPIGPARPVAGTPRPSLSTPLWAEGETVAADHGTFVNGANFTTYAYRWQACSGTPLACSDLADVTGSDYTPQPADSGKRLRVLVTATNPFGKGRAVSPLGGTIGRPYGDEAPSLTGANPPVVGAEQTASAGTWDNAPTTYAYAWQRCSATAPGSCSPIAEPDATDDADYTPTAADAGSRLRIRVTATNAIGSASAVSRLSRPVVTPDGA